MRERMEFVSETPCTQEERVWNRHRERLYLLGSTPIIPGHVDRYKILQRMKALYTVIAWEIDDVGLDHDHEIWRDSLHTVLPVL